MNAHERPRTDALPGHVRRSLEVLPGADLVDFAEVTGIPSGFVAGGGRFGLGPTASVAAFACSAGFIAPAAAVARAAARRAASSPTVGVTLAARTGAPQHDCPEDSHYPKLGSHRFSPSCVSPSLIAEQDTRGGLRAEPRRAVTSTHMPSVGVSRSHGSRDYRWVLF